MITIYTVAYNEENQLPFLIEFYRLRFPNCEIIVYDNMSTDNTVNIAKTNNCKIISYDTNNQISDRKYLEIKNNCWKTSTTDWVLVCDVDELLDINSNDLIYENAKGSSIIKSEGYNMVNMEGDTDLYSIKYGARHIESDKSYLFNKSYIKEINYQPGCHVCNPVGKICYSEKSYKAYHYNFINEKLTLEKHKIYAGRLSQDNLKHGWGSHYLLSEDAVLKAYEQVRKNAIRLI